MAQLSVEAVTIRYPTEDGGFTAVHDVSFEVEQGEKFVILGPSGCGKSTLLKAIAGLLPIAAGALRLNGQAIRQPGPDRMMVFQEFDQLLPWKTVLGNVTFALKVGRKLSEARAREAAIPFISMVGLEKFSGVYPHTLSGGMKQRVAIARALALDPAMLLMDEPFASLDALTRSRMQAELHSIWEKTGKTILFVTHSIAEAVRLGHRILVLRGSPGRVGAIYINRAEGRYDSPSLRAEVEREVSALVEGAAGG